MFGIKKALLTNKKPTIECAGCTNFDREKGENRMTKEYLVTENQRNKKFASLYVRLLKEAFCAISATIIGHHLTFECEGNSSNEIPSADTLLFDHDAMTKCFGRKKGMELMQSFASVPAEQRERILELAFADKDGMPTIHEIDLIPVGNQMWMVKQNGKVMFQGKEERAKLVFSMLENEKRNERAAAYNEKMQWIPESELERVK